MARQSITVTVATHAGVTYPTPQGDIPADDAEIEDNDGRIILIMENVSTSARTVTIQCAATYGDPPIPLEDQVISLAPSAMKVAGPFAANLFNQTGDGGTRSVLVDINGGSNGDIEFVALQVPIAVSGMADVCAEYSLGSLRINDADEDNDTLMVNDQGNIDGLDGVPLRRSVAPQGQADGAILLPAFKAWRVVTFTGVELIRSVSWEDGQAAFIAASNALEAAWVAAFDAIENTPGSLSWPGHSLVVYKAAGPNFSGPTWGKKFIMSFYAPDPTIS